MGSILLFDDINAEREDAKYCLEQLISKGKLSESEIFEATTQEEAMNIRRRRKDISLAVLDIVCSSAITGVEIARDIQGEREIPIALITGSYSGSDFPTFKEWVMEGNGKNTAVSICAKLGFGPLTLDEYANALGMTINEAKSKMGRGNDVDFYNKVIARMKGEMDINLYSALSVLFKQVRARLTYLLSMIDDREFEEKASKAPWLFEESKDDTTLLHNMKKPGVIYDMCNHASVMGEGIPLNQRFPEIFKQIKLMRDVIEYVINSKHEYSPLFDDVVNHKRKLTTAERKPFPDIGYAKLVNRKRMLEDQKIPHFVVKPGENPTGYRADFERVMKVTGQVIARSMGLEDSLGFPMAGMYDSKGGIASFGELIDAIEEIRSMKSHKLEDFLLGKGLKKPEGTMNVMVEPYYPTRYLGSVLQHHNFPGIFLVEYYERGAVKEERSNFTLMYDAQLQTVLAHNSISGINPLVLGKSVYGAFVRSREVCKAADDVALQMEFTFDDASSIRPVQLRNSKRIDNLGSMAVKDYLLFGNTGGESEEMVVLYPDTAPQVSLVSERAREKGYKLCMVIRSEDEKKTHLAAIPYNLGLVIAGKGLVVQNHDFFNALVNADNFLSLPKDYCIEQLKLHGGQRICYSSEGKSYRIEPIDNSTEIIQGIKNIINSS